MNFSVIPPEELPERLAASPSTCCTAMYSSHLGGIVTDPAFMVIPVEDHLVHRGDGVFETLKCVEGGIYNGKAHLDRLNRSAQAIALQHPFTHDDLMEAMVQTIRASQSTNCLIRILLSRGTGSLGVNPYDCPKPSLHIITSSLNQPIMEQQPGGVSGTFSDILAKPGMLASIKSCNYLLNAMMKKEAVDKQVDFTIGLDEKGEVTEAPTESIALVTTSNELAAPPPGVILEGTTLVRTFELAQHHQKELGLSSVVRRPLCLADINTAKEILVIGTTHNIAAMTTLHQRAVGDGKPGPVYQALLKHLEKDILENPSLRHLV